MMKEKEGMVKSHFKMLLYINHLLLLVVEEKITFKMFSSKGAYILQKYTARDLLEDVIR